MGQGLNLAGGLGAGAAGATLGDILRDARAEQIRREALKLQAQGLEQQLAQEAERARQFQLTHERGLAADKSLADYRAAEAARDRAVADQQTNRQRGIQAIIDDPATPAPVRGLLRMNALGVTNLNVHDVEGPEAHAAHTRAENQLKADTAFRDFQRRADYSEGLRRSRPATAAANMRLRPGQDDPALPRGTQAYLVEIARKHPGNYEAAVAELSEYLQDPQTQADHPNLSPQKALAALKQSFTGVGRPLAGGSSDPAVAGAVAGAMRQVVTDADAPPAGTPPRAAGGGGQVVDEAQLRARAQAALQQRLGRPPSDAEVSTVLANPKNRQLLGGQ